MNTNELIDKYLTNEATAEEHKALLQYIHESEENKKEFSDACQLWYSLHSNKFNNTKAFEKFTKQTKAKTISLWQKLSAAAAVATIIIITCFSIFNKQEINNITIANNEKYTKAVTLPDGSAIFLHKNSSVTYPEQFASNNRTISITGNVFCEITRNESAPFTLTSNKLSINVLGTSFQVNTIDSTYVIVESGKVKVTHENQSVTLEKGQRTDLRNSKLTSSENTDLNFLSWKTGILQFRNTTLPKVFSDISRHYNCEFTINNDCTGIATTSLTGSYQDLKIDQVLQMIEMAIPEFHYEIHNNEIIVSTNK
ncbi:MAG: FecR family protein [Bacteroidales bacterium]|nr:FecR family protein [Bacteroidales bacterium]